MKDPASWSQLTKEEKQHLLGDGNSLYEIGGHHTEVKNLAWSLYNLARDHYPINDVPEQLKFAVDMLLLSADAMENNITLILELMAQEVIKNRNARPTT